MSIQKSAANFASLALAALAYFTLALIVLHIVRSDRDPRWNFISDYAVGPYGLLMNSAFLALSLCFLFLLVGLLQAGPRTRTSRIGLCVFAVLVPGTLVAALFNADVTPPPTLHGAIHAYDAMVNFTCLALGVALISFGALAEKGWRACGRTASVLAIGIALAYVGQFVAMQIETRSRPLAGTVNRALVALVVIWLLHTALRIRSGAAAQGAPSS